MNACLTDLTAVARSFLRNHVGCMQRHSLWPQLHQHSPRNKRRLMFFLWAIRLGCGRMKTHESDYKNYKQATGERYFYLFIHVDPRTGGTQCWVRRGSERGRCAQQPSIQGDTKVRARYVPLTKSARPNPTNEWFSKLGGTTSSELYRMMQMLLNLGDTS